MQRLLLISGGFPPHIGGNGRWMWELYSRMPQLNCIIAADQSTQCAVFDRTHDLSVVRMPLQLNSWGALGWRRGCAYYRAYVELSRVLRDQNVRTMHASNCLPDGFLAWTLYRRFRVPYLIYAHGEELNIAGRSRELTWMARRVFRNANIVIANSRNTAHLLRSNWGVPSDRLDVMHPGVNTNLFRPADSNPHVRRRLGWDDRPVILTVGRLQKRKGQEQVVLALPDIRRRIPNVLYAIVGDGDERGRLEQLTAELGLGDHVKFHGEVQNDDLISVYQQCDVFAMPNLEVDGDFEGFGIVFLEAQACGKPVIGGDSGGASEAIDAPDSGRIVHANRTSELAQTLIELLIDDSLRTKMGQAGRRWTEKNFDWDILAAQALELFAGGADGNMRDSNPDAVVVDELDGGEAPQLHVPVQLPLANLEKWPSA